MFRVLQVHNPQLTHYAAPVAGCGHAYIPCPLALCCARSATSTNLLSITGVTHFTVLAVRCTLHIPLACMSRITRGKRTRAAATGSFRGSRPAVASSPPPPLVRTADEQHEGVEDGDELVDWAAEFEDVEQLESEYKQHSPHGSSTDITARRRQSNAKRRSESRVAVSVSEKVKQQRIVSSEEMKATYTTPPSRSLHLQYDNLFRIPVPRQQQLPPSLAAYIHSLHAAFTTALSDRVRYFHLHSAEQPGSQQLHLLLSIALSHPSSSPFRSLDLGPDASSPAASEWRSYWKERTELRRFKDGRVLECVMWRAESESEVEEERTMGEASVLLRIVRWVMTRKGQLKDTADIRFVGWQAYQLMKRRQLLSTHPFLLASTPSVVSAPSDSAALQSTFSSLSSLLKSLSLPLSFTSITAVHPFFRYTDPFPPLPLSAELVRLSPSLPVVDVVAQFESSSAWPSSLYAIQQIKTAFVIELSSSLASASSTLISSSTVSYTHLDVLTAEPAAYCFRVHLLHHGELQPLSLLLHQSLRSFALRRGEGGLWAGLVCLAKRWVQCHMWSELVDGYVVELLCAAWWIAAGRGEEEADEENEGGTSKQADDDSTAGVSNPLVLLIGWLEWLGECDFSSGPLVVPLPALSAGSSTSAHPSSVSSASSDTPTPLFDRALAAYKNRIADASAANPLPALYIATPVDLTSSITSPHLTAALVSRLQLMAASCASHLSGLFSGCELVGWLSAFKPDTTSFNCLLHLRADVLSWETLQSSIGRVRGASQEEEDGDRLPAQDSNEVAAASVSGVRAKRRKVSGYKAPIDEHKEEASRRHEILLGVDVQLEYVRALQQQLGAYIDVHADLYGGSVIGVRMKQRGRSKWKVRESGYTSWRVGSGTEGEWNVHEMLADMQLIGHGILERVELQPTRAQDI